MDILSKNRVRLIRALIESKSANISEKAIANLASIVNGIREDKAGHYLSMLKPTSTVEVSYAKTGNKSKKSSDRVITTLGRYIRRHLQITTEHLSEAELDFIGKNVGRLLFDTKAIETNMVQLTGVDIEKHYQTTDTHSCMVGSHAWKVRLYTLNPDKVSLLVYGKKVRALLWTCDDGTKVLDRIYPAGVAEVEYIRKWAEIKGYVLRVNADRAPSSSISEPLSDNSVKTLTVKFGDSFPYLDTFRFIGKLNKENKTVILSNAKTYFEKDSCKYYEGLGTGGEIPFKNELYKPALVCHECGCHLFDGEQYRTRNLNYCRECWNNLFFECADCGEIHSVDDQYKISDLNRKVCANCIGAYYYCDCCGKYLSVKPLNVKEHGKYCSDCYANYCTQCKNCDMHLLKDDTITFDGNDYCEDCHNRLFVNCHSCGEAFNKQDMQEIDGDFYCDDCNEE